jgi:hypothetical protein
MFAHQPTADNPQRLQELADQLGQYVHDAAQQGTPAHLVEEGIFRRVLALGYAAQGLFFNLHGSGDQGPTVTLPDEHICQRLPDLHRRRYVSVFGTFHLQRTVYGSREGQVIEFVPLDNRLQLPAADFSYLLQDWDQAFCVEQAFGQASSNVARILGLTQSVDSLEHLNVAMAQRVTDFRENRPQPDPQSEGELLVLSGDGKGIVMRREADEPAPPAHRTKGDKASRQQMATVGTAYTVDRYVRSPEQVVAALFGDPQPTPAPARPEPCHKRVWASLPQIDEDGQARSSQDIVFDWLLNEVAERNRKLDKEMVQLYDGQDCLWDAARQHLPQRNSTGILDVLHVTPRLWQAAHCFCKEGSDEAAVFVRERLLRVLRGEVMLVVRGWRQMGTKRGLTGSKKKTLAKVCQYLENNRDHMKYDEYLAKGYPIASGVIEGACRHLVKDRLERAGMHWRPEGAQAMLDLRSTYVNGDWQEYQTYRIERETQRLYPHRHLVTGPQYFLAV